jgi:hypothetical protein
MRCGMSSKIVWPQLSSGELACLLHNQSCRRISDREYSVVGFNPFVPDILVEPISDLPRDEHDFSFSSALWSLQDKILIDHIFRGEFQDLSDSHSSPGHQFQYKSISQFERPEDDLINRFFLHNVPVVRLSRPIQLPEHRRITGVLQA